MWLFLRLKIFYLKRKIRKGVVKLFIRLFHCQDFNYYFSYNFNFELKQINYIFYCQAI